ncbi:hypothetical protein VNO77_04188 [Canavalia gladiata]|uniref:Uncharacterized protein n=1 Tax=Canavalia gladiata TaxID=3824 RepID=A0AAN9RCY4_CANGL
MIEFTDFKSPKLLGILQLAIKVVLLSDSNFTGNLKVGFFVRYRCGLETVKALLWSNSKCFSVMYALEIFLSGADRILCL